MRATIIISKSNYLYFNVRGETFKGSGVNVKPPFYAAYIIGSTGEKHIVAASEDKDELMAVMANHHLNEFLSKV